MKCRKQFIWALAFALSALGFSFVGGCDDATIPAPPIGTPNDPVLPGPEPSTGEASTGEPELCPWDGTCAALDLIDECGGWAISCGDGWRCVSPEVEGGIVCEVGESSSSEGGSTDGC